MSRIHLFEFEDLPWFPGFLRNYGTDFLQFLSNATNMFRPAIPIIVNGVNSSGQKTIIDLGSGGGGGWIKLSEELIKEMPEIKILLSDLYPNKNAFERISKTYENIDFIDTAVDARQVPESYSGLRTQFLSLHHFKPDDAVKILENAVQENQPIAIFEAQERSVPSLLAMFFSPITVLLTTPFIKPFKIGRIIFTYLIPIVPLFVWWDGIISALRTYSVSEMDQLIRQVKDNDKFKWETGKIKSGPGVLLYLLGMKK